MNIGKIQNWDNIPTRDIFLSTGEKIGMIVMGIDYVDEDEEA